MIRPKMIRSNIKIPEELNSRVIDKLVNDHKRYLYRYKKLQSYYEGKTDILERKKQDPTKPNNKTVSPYPSYIVDLMQGMFIGKPVSYTSINKEYMKDVQEIFNNSDEQDENSELSKMAGIKGKAYEIVFMDEEGNIGFNEEDADNMIAVYDTKIKPEMILAVRLYNDNDLLGNKNIEYATAYTKDEIIEYINDGQGFKEDSRKDHYFNQVPVIEFLNNDEYIGDFERAIPNIDAYEKAQSDTANDFEEFTDAFLVLAGMMGTDEEDATKLKENKIILVDGQGQNAYWLIKEINDTALENYKNRLNDDIHKMTKVPDMSDDKFSGNASGVALEHKLLALEQVLSSKERKFKRGLQKRLELITEILNKFDKGYNYTDIKITFTRNKPVNIKEAVEIASMLSGFTSNSTALSALPMVDDVQAEEEKIAKEKDAYKDESIDLDNLDDEGNGNMKVLEFISKLPQKDRDVAKDILEDTKNKKVDD